MKLVLVLLMLLAPVADAAKKPKPIRPYACAGPVCVSDLTWQFGTRGAVVITGTVITTVQLRYLTLTFPLLNEENSIVGSAVASSISPIPANGRWEFQAVGGLAGRPIVTISVELASLVETSGVSTDAREVLAFDPVYEPTERPAQKRWRSLTGR